MTAPAARVVWTPREGLPETNIGRFARMVATTRGIDVHAYEAMWQWSVDDLPGFWSAIWDFFDLGAPVAPERVLTDDRMPGATWFPDAHVNFAAHVLGTRSDPDAVAIITVGEDSEREELTWAQLRARVAALAATLRDLGVGSEDVVVGYLPNIAETIIAALATTSLGAIWSGVGQDYAPRAAIDRFAQLEPVVLVAADGHHFAGKARDQREAVAAVRAGLPTVRHTIGVTRLGHGVPDAIPFGVAVSVEAPFAPVETAFGHPLWVLFSSGTTGLPKGIVHSHGGVLLEQTKLMGLHWDMGAEDRLLWYTSPSWIMWNALIGAMMQGASVVCFDGAPLAEGPAALWAIAARERVTMLGASPGFLALSQDSGVRPAVDHDLTSLRIMGSTGAPLPDRAFDYVASEVGPVPLWSMSGGTDVAGAFAIGAPNVPVWAGELSVRALGIAMEAWTDSGESVVDAVGELVVTRPMPSMPIRFWNDPDDERYRAAYFEQFPGVWRHGDWITVTDRGSVVVHGRSDSTLNRHGVRMGSSDIYAAVEPMPEVVEALVIGAEEADGGYWMPLFVVLADGSSLDDSLEAVMRHRVRELASPRHVPDEIIAVPGIPHTKTGKKLEVPIKRLIQGAAYADVVDPSVVDDPALMDQFRAIADARLAAVRHRDDGRRAAVRR